MNSITHINIKKYK